MGSHDDGKTARARCDDKVVAIVSTADATRTGLPDAILVQRILDAILRFMGLDETMRNKCDAVRIKSIQAPLVRTFLNSNGDVQLFFIA